MVRSFVGDPEGRMTLGRGTTARAAHTGGGTSVQDIKKNYRDENRKTMSLQLSQTQKTGSSGSGVKALVADMQQKIAEQDATINILSQRIDEIEREKDRINDAVGKHVFTLDSRMTKEVESLKEDLEHKFALQVAENKRLLNQLVKQKNEQGAMRKYIEALEERIRLLQDEVGI